MTGGMFIWELARLSDTDLQRLFDLAYCLHPQTAVVFELLPKACIRTERVQRTQNKNPGGETFYKLPTPTECLWQLGVYLESEVWEKDQEGTHPAKQPTYQPTPSDLVTRYIKLLIMETMLRRSFYGAVGLGSFLFTYHPGDIERLFEQFYDPDNLRNRKKWLLDRIEERFPDVERIREERGTARLRMRPPQADERAWISNALIAMRPWFPTTPAHISTAQNASSILERYFGYEAKRDELHEWWRIHALVDPECAGFAALVNAFNERHKYMKLNDPEQQFGLPLFHGHLPPVGRYDAGDRGPRFQPQPLTPQELKNLRQTLIAALQRDQQRLQEFRGEDFLVYVQGEMYRQIHAGNGAPESFTVPATASFLEIYGRDATGDVLLATFLLPAADLDDAQPEQHLVVHHDNGLTLELATSPDRADPEASDAVRLQVQHEAMQPQVVPQVTARPSLGTRVWEWLSAAWHPPLAGEMVTAAGTQAQEHVFTLDEGQIRVRCDWWTPESGHPGMLRITWHASVTRATDFWARFTRADDPAVLLAVARLGDYPNGDKMYTADVLGFDPTRQPWALTIVLREPQS